MSALLDAIFRLGWQGWATAVGVVFGIVGVIAYVEQRRAAKGQMAVIEFVKRHVAKDISEETIKALEQQRAALQVQVVEYIPALARAAVLKEQAAVHAAALSRHFIEWKRIQDELKASPTEGGLDPAIESVIVDRLVPKYEREVAVEATRNRITAFSVALALASSLSAPLYPANLIIVGLLVIPLVSGLFDLIRLSSRPEQWVVILRLIYWGNYGGFLVISFGAALIIIASPDGLKNPVGETLTWIFLAVGAVGLASFPFVRRIINSIPRKISISEAGVANQGAAPDV